MGRALGNTSSWESRQKATRCRERKDFACSVPSNVPFSYFSSNQYDLDYMFTEFPGSLEEPPLQKYFRSFIFEGESFSDSSRN